jgi:hypothetical protein
MEKFSITEDFPYLQQMSKRKPAVILPAAMQELMEFKEEAAAVQIVCTPTIIN